MTIFDKWEDSQPEFSQCIDCKWKNIGEMGCKAFPDIIPDEILSNEKKHNKPFKNQIGDFVYEKIDQKD